MSSPCKRHNLGEATVTPAERGLFEHTRECQTCHALEIATRDSTDPRSERLGIRVVVRTPCDLTGHDWGGPDVRPAVRKVTPFIAEHIWPCLRPDCRWSKSVGVDLISGQALMDPSYMEREAGPSPKTEPPATHRLNASRFNRR